MDSTTGGNATVTRGDETSIFGMHLRIDRENKTAILTQPTWEQKVIQEFKVLRKAPVPALMI